MIRLLVTSGRGPAECRIALSNVLAAMAAEATAAGLDLDVAQGPLPDRHGPASAVIVLDGADAEAFARGWTGSIQWVAESPIRPHHRRKNWFVGVARLPPPTAPARLDAAEVRFEALRVGGPGGQHQNKTESAVRAVHGPSGLTVVAREARSQHRNRALALERLAALVAAQAEMAQAGDRLAIQAGHDQLERGNPVRRFTGREFRAVRG